MDSLDGDPNLVRLVGGDKIGLYVLGLQEVVDPQCGPVREPRLRRYGIECHGEVEDGMEAALPAGYELVSCEQMTGLLLLVYASPEVAPRSATLAPRLSGPGCLGIWATRAR